MNPLEQPDGSESTGATDVPPDHRRSRRRWRCMQGTSAPGPMAPDPRATRRSDGRGGPPEP